MEPSIKHQILSSQKLIQRKIHSPIILALIIKKNSRQHLHITCYILCININLLQTEKTLEKETVAAFFPKPEAQPPCQDGKSKKKEGQR